ncbi:hypothetical protein HBB16_01585 [Pseudonocardia sp. MCCB 268]|nr:hypothetical protein [Pseudonocardia cytotoxica]
MPVVGMVGGGQLARMTRRPPYEANAAGTRRVERRPYGPVTPTSSSLTRTGPPCASSPPAARRSTFDHGGVPQGSSFWRSRSRYASARRPSCTPRTSC